MREDENKNNGLGDIKSLILDDKKLFLEVDRHYIRKLSNFNIIFRERKSKDKFIADFKIEDNYIVIDLETFIKTYKSIVSRWDCYIETKGINLIRVGKYSSEIETVNKRYLKSVSVENSVNTITPYLTNENEVSIVIKHGAKLDSEKIKYLVHTRIINADIKDGIFSGKFSLSVKECENFSIDDLKLQLRNDSKEISYYIDVNVYKKNNHKFIVKFKINFLEYQFESFYWDIFVGFTLDGEKYYIKLKNPTIKVQRELNSKVSKYEYELKDDFMIYPYLTKDHALAFNYRLRGYYENRDYRFKENLAYFIYIVFKFYFDSKNIWLGYEKFSETAQDNGFYFFDYCYRNNKHKNFYYIIKEDSPDIKNLKGKEDKVIKFMSFKYMLYLYAAKLLIASESKGHCYDIRIQKGRLKKALDRKKMVFLQHGVIAFKKVEFFMKSKNKMDLFVVSSDYEKEIIEKYFEYNEKEIINTGLCRWDALEDKVDPNNKEILIMPTWRSWMDGVSDEEFIKSDYYKNYYDLLNSQELHKIIKEKNIKLNFFIHPKFKEYIGNFTADNENINIYQFGEIELNKLLMKISLLITDYSSVAWDVYYQKKPVIFYQFDIKEYDMYQGGYMDMENELYGDRIFDMDKLVATIKDYISRDFKEKEQYGSMRSVYFSHVDKNNSARVYNAIKQRKNMLKRSKYDYFLMLKSNLYIKTIWYIIKKNKALKKLAKKVIKFLKR